MSSNKNQKWSSPVSLTKLFSRITRTLSFSSKKRQQSLKKTNKVWSKPQSIPTNTLFAPKSVPIIRRQAPQLIAQILYNDNSRPGNCYQQAMHVNMYNKINFEENDDDDDDNYSRYSLQPNLSLFNISSDNLHYQREECYEQIPQQQNWLDNIFHSTKIEHS
ncbi:unnamed protein product [Rotaria sordida]|uniref:Uncharacterized protein n=1 Tax=Rotaria sordida TaxID=392033 RepID=A0A815FZ40_9BILA|nr:unnamed protein product [Rotaria sordida]CAF1225373.1 unnamed protein product [Rotaria sordida]CAF1331792.1 unnamed protein product [Rotaria sordida]CAF1505590.1 unnamed protein product [Rotaria sordida]